MLCSNVCHLQDHSGSVHSGPDASLVCYEPGVLCKVLVHIAAGLGHTWPFPPAAFTSPALLAAGLGLAAAFLGLTDLPSFSSCASTLSCNQGQASAHVHCAQDS